MARSRIWKSRLRNIPIETEIEDHNRKLPLMEVGSCFNTHGVACIQKRFNCMRMGLGIDNDEERGTKSMTLIE